MSISSDVQKIASASDKITRKIYSEGFLLIQKIKPGEVSEINQKLDDILNQIRKISTRSFKD